MVKIQIGPIEKDWKDVDQHWLCNEIQGRRHAGQPVCVRVQVNEGTLNMTLNTPGCRSGGGGGRRPNNQEQEVFDLWAKLHLNEPDFSCGNVHAFMVQLKKFF